MVLNNNNKNFIKTLSNNCLKANRNRNIIAVLAIILTAVLLTALATVAQGTMISTKEQMFRQAGTRYMAVSYTHLLHSRTWLHPVSLPISLPAT